jgi:hypothetical protein
METAIMKTNSSTAHSGIGWLVSKSISRQQKRQAAADANTIDNLDRPYQLKVKGVLSDDEFEELKERMKAKI